MNNGVPEMPGSTLCALLLDKRGMHLRVGPEAIFQPFDIGSKPLKPGTSHGGVYQKSNQRYQDHGDLIASHDHP
jgi:hypothetical protein